MSKQCKEVEIHGDGGLLQPAKLVVAVAGYPSSVQEQITRLEEIPIPERSDSTSAPHARKKLY